MSKRTIKRVVWTIVVLCLLIGGGYLGVQWLERTVHERSERIITQIGGPGSRIDIGEVEIKLLQGDIRWTDLRIDQPEEDPDSAAGDTPMRISGRVDQVAVRGLSLLRLLFAQTLSMRSITISHPDIEMILMRDTTGGAAPRSGSVDLSAFNADSMVVEHAVFRMHRAGDSTDLVVDTMDLHVTGLRSRWGDDKPFELHFGTATGQVVGIHAKLPPMYDLRVARIELDQDGSALHVTDVTLKPLKGPQEYDRVLHFETDMFDAHMDTAMMDGLDLAALINARTLTTSTMRIAGVELSVFRDKTMPDEPYKIKPLPARLVRELPIAVCLDSLVVDRWNVHYHEKDDLSRDFGEVAITDIRGVVTGLCSADTLRRDTMVVMATARGYDKADITLEVRTVIGDRSDRFTAEARIGRLPFQVFNRMTADLLLVRATAGSIGAVHMKMTANKERASGRVDMEYNGLKVDILKQDGSGEKKKFMSSLANFVVHTKNLRSDPGFRHGDFEFERRKDRSIFNYLWSGLREGMIATALPGVLESVRQIDQPGRKK